MKCVLRYVEQLWGKDVLWTIVVQLYKKVKPGLEKKSLPFFVSLGRRTFRN